MRDYALQRIERLDCCGNPDKTLASCDPAAAPPPDVLKSQKKLAARARVEDEAYARALAKELQNLVCATDVNAIYILRGLVRGVVEVEHYGSLPGREAHAALVDFIMSKSCPVSASLTDDDKARLLRIKQGAKKKFGPPPASKNEK
jgi:hypothetical protein